MTTRRRHYSTENNGGQYSSSYNYQQQPYQQQQAPSGWTVTTSSETPAPNSQGFASQQPVDMTCRDRTHEFFSTVKSMQSRQGNGITSHRENPGVHQQHSEFMLIAKHIGKDLSNSFAKLQKLTILAKRKSLFDDKSLEIQELTYIIKQDINSLNKQIGQLQQIVKSKRSQNGRHMQTHSNTVVLALQSKLANMSNDFKTVLEVRTQNLKDQKDRREQFSQSPGPTSLPSAANGHSGSVLLQDEQSRNDIAIDMSAFDSGPRQRAQMQVVEEQDNYIKSREETMHNIESTIVELSTIFQQLAHMVKEQEEQVQRIDSNIDDTALNVEAAHGEILKYFQSVTSNRWLMIKIFVVLIVFFVVFVVFFA